VSGQLRHLQQDPQGVGGANMAIAVDVARYAGYQRLRNASTAAQRRSGGDRHSGEEEYSRDPKHRRLLAAAGRPRAFDSSV